MTRAARQPPPRRAPDLRRVTRLTCVRCGLVVWALALEPGEIHDFRCTVCRGGERMRRTA